MGSKKALVTQKARERADNLAESDYSLIGVDVMLEGADENIDIMLVDFDKPVVRLENYEIENLESSIDIPDEPPESWQEALSRTGCSYTYSRIKTGLSELVPESSDGREWDFCYTSMDDSYSPLIKDILGYDPTDRDDMEVKSRNEVCTGV